VALKVLRIQKKKPFGKQIVHELRVIAGNKDFPVETRLLAMTLIPPRDRNFDDATVAFLCDHIVSDRPVQLRGLATEVLQKTKLSLPQLRRLAETVPNTGPMELRRVIEILVASNDPAIGRVLVESLKKCPSATSLRPDELQQQLAAFGDSVREQGEPVIASIRSENAALLDKLEAILTLTKEADVRNGQRIFDGQKASCSACHAAGYVGGRIGPGLMRIGRIRTERDLLESILFPSASFVQSYEPVTIVTTDGRVYNGLVKEESNDRLELQLDAQKTATIKVSDIEERREGTVSIMPAGLDKQLTLQELADLVAFLKSAN
jgi:putative heme-binding domain-containing protein